jgi:multiple sugar transport system substrate-binding protein
MIRSTRMIALAALATAGALALSGCAGGAAPAASGGPIDTKGELSGTISFQTWSLKNEKFTPYFEDLIAGFEKAHPKVTVKWLDQPGDGYQDKILSQANSGTLPDVLNLPPDIAYPLATAGKLVDLKAADPALAKVYVPGAWDSYSYPGVKGTYGLPWYLGTDLSWWNGAALKPYGVTADDLPATTDELLDTAKTVAKKSGGTVQLLSTMPTIDAFAAGGVKILDDKGAFVFDTAEAAKIVDGYTAAYRAGAIPAEVLTGDYGGNADMFKQGKVAFTTAGSGFAGDLTTDAPTIRQSALVSPRIGTAPLYVQGVNVSNDSKDKPAALAFAEYVTDTENQVAFAKLAVGFMPGTIEGSADAAALSASITDPLQRTAVGIVSDEMKTAKILTPFQWTGAMTTYLSQQMALALQGNVSAEDALQKVVAYANQNRVKP